MSLNTGISDLAKGLEKLQLSSGQTTKKIANTVRGMLPFSGVRVAPAAATAATAAPAATAATAATSAIDPYKFDCILQFTVGGDKRNIENLKKISKKEKLEYPRRIVETAEQLLKIPHFAAHDQSSSYTRYYINKAAYFDNIKNNPYFKAHPLYDEFWILDFKNPEEAKTATILGERLRASKSGGTRKYKKHTTRKNHTMRKKSTRKHK